MVFKKNEIIKNSSNIIKLFKPKKIEFHVKEKLKLDKSLELQ